VDGLQNDLLIKEKNLKKLKFNNLKGKKLIADAKSGIENIAKKNLGLETFELTNEEIQRLEEMIVEKYLESQVPVKLSEE